MALTLELFLQSPRKTGQWKKTGKNVAQIEMTIVLQEQLINRRNLLYETPILVLLYWEAGQQQITSGFERLSEKGLGPKSTHIG